MWIGLVSRLTYCAPNFTPIQPAQPTSSLISSMRSSPTFSTDTVLCMNGIDLYQLDEIAGGCHQKQSKPRDNDDSWRDAGNLHTRPRTTCPTENRVALQTKSSSRHEAVSTTTEFSPPPPTHVDAGRQYGISCT